MNTNRNHFQKAIFAAAVLLTFSSAAVASGFHAAMHESFNHGTKAMMVPCNEPSSDSTISGRSGIAVGFGETDPASTLLLPEADQRKESIARASGVTVGFAETDPATTAIGNDATVLQQTKNAGALAMHGHSCQTGSVSANQDTKMPANCKC